MYTCLSQGRSIWNRGRSEGSPTTALNGLAGDVLALVGDQESNKLCDILRLLNAAKFNIALDADLLRGADADALLQCGVRSKARRQR